MQIQFTDKKIQQETLDICKRNGLEPIKFQKDININDKNLKYILVDHHERDVAGEIVCIIDHHPTSKDIKINYKKGLKKFCSVSRIFLFHLFAQLSYRKLLTNQK